jgi:hypothetical protein
MRDTIRGIVGKLRKGINGYILVTVDADYTIQSYDSIYYGEMTNRLYGRDNEIIVGWYHDPIKMSALRDQIERRIGGIGI